jgi:NAD(P)-dependent dehydrogenase (short-subunit alcohol dehydrogenase family)
MSKARTVVITGASRGLGLASSAELYRRGWCVVGAMRLTESGLDRLREATGARSDDPRLLGVNLDLIDPESVSAAGKDIVEKVGAPDALVHNAAVASAGFAEETPATEWTRLFQTNLFGPVALTNALLPAMRSAGHGRVVVVSSTVAVRGMPISSIYSATKAGLERWAESLAAEIAPHGLGVTILTAGTYATDITGDATPVFQDLDGPNGSMHPKMEKRGRAAVKVANPPERFAKSLARSLERDRGPIVHRGVGIDAKIFRTVGRFTPTAVMHQLVRVGFAQPRFGALRETR